MYKVNIIGYMVIKVSECYKYVHVWSVPHFSANRTLSWTGLLPNLFLADKSGDGF